MMRIAAFGGQVEAKVERQQGWAHAGQGARLGASSTNAPPH